MGYRRFFNSILFLAVINLRLILCNGVTKGALYTGHHPHISQSYDLFVAGMSI